jgi:hypothetical protein
MAESIINLDEVADVDNRMTSARKLELMFVYSKAGYPLTQTLTRVEIP